MMNNNNNNNNSQQSSAAAAVNPVVVAPASAPAVIATTITPAMMPPLPTQREARPEDEYGDEIYDHLFSRQHNTLRDATYLQRQREVEERMRIILIDWLVDVSLKFRQRPETFFLAVDVVDRYLMLQQVTRGSLQLVGITAILIAAKHEEIWAPEVRECAQITANTYSKEDIVRVERDICGALRYRFTLPTPYTFCIRLMQMAETEIAYNTNLDHLVHFFLELSALHYPMLNWRPSTVALAAFILGRITWHHRALLGSQGYSDICLLTETADEWVPEYLDEGSRQFCRIQAVADIAPAVRELLAFATETSRPEYRFRAVHRKYAHDKYGNVSRDPIVLPPMSSNSNNSNGNTTTTTNNNSGNNSNTSTQQQAPGMMIINRNNSTENNSGDTHLDEDSNLSAN